MGRYYQRSHGRSLDSNNSNADAWQQSSTARVGRVRGGSEPHSAAVFTKISLVDCKTEKAREDSNAAKGKSIFKSTRNGDDPGVGICFARKGSEQFVLWRGEETGRWCRSNA